VDSEQDSASVWRSFLASHIVKFEEADSNGRLPKEAIEDLPLAVLLIFISPQRRMGPLATT
jgi:hypothetical protein